MSKIEVDAIDKQSGSTLTLGGSGTAVTLASGATQSGFGREGSVDWQTTIKTGDFTAVSGEGYFINTTSGTITMTLPSSPSVGDIVALKDYANTFDTNNLTIDRNGSNISGLASNAIISTEGQALTLVYGDSTKGWQSVAASTESDLPKPAFVTATGGTITTVCTNFKVHTFTGPGTFSITCAGNSLGSTSVDYLVVAGGGGGGYTTGCNGGAGGGGAGGYRESSGTASGSYTVSPLGSGVSAKTATVADFPITVGGGGAAGAAPPSGPICQNAPAKGSSSTFSTITSTGGGGGGYNGNCVTAKPGGSGGGGGNGSSPPVRVGGSGNTPPVSPAQGRDGGNGVNCSAEQGTGGGGGAINEGGDGGTTSNGDGGAGATSSINGTPTARAGGGGGGGNNAGGSPGGDSTGGAGGAGGGGAGGSYPNNSPAATAGTTNTGGGGGAGGAGPDADNAGAAGGSGIVIIRYKFQ